jgi:hypothetical protein
VLQGAGPRSSTIAVLKNYLFGGGNGAGILRITMKSAQFRHSLKELAALLQLFSRRFSALQTHISPDK